MTAVKLIEISEPDPAVAADRLLGASCTLGLAEMRARVREWGALRDRSIGLRPITGGVAVSLSAAEPLGVVADLLAKESECCPFYSFRLSIDGPSRALEITAGAGREIAVRVLLGIA